MINDFSLSAVEILAKELADRNIAVVVKPDSYLGNIAGLADAGTCLDIPEYSEMTTNERISANFNNQLHDAAQDKLIKNIQFANNNILNLAKNKVIPLVNFMADRYSEHIANVESTASLPLTVAVVEDDSFWGNDLFRDCVNSLPIDYSADVKLSIKFPATDRDELLLMAKTGLARFDKQLEEAIERYESSEGIDLYEDVWNNVFSKTGNRNVYTLTEYYRGQQNVILYHLPVLWAILRYLSNEANIPAGMNCSIIDYRDFITAALSNINTIVNTQIASYDKDKKRNKMIISFPSEKVDGKRKQNIRVKKAVYEDFLSKGGSVDAILGSCVTDRSTTVDAILDQKDFYENEWRRHHALIHSVVTSEIRETKRSGIKAALVLTSQEYDKQILAETNPDIDPNESGVNFRYNYWVDIPESIRKFVEDLDDHKLSEINYISQQLICDLLFPESDVYKILNDVNEHGKADSSLSPKEALTMAISDYIINWTFDQLEFIQKG